MPKRLSEEAILFQSHINKHSLAIALSKTEEVGESEAPSTRHENTKTINEMIN